MKTSNNFSRGLGLSIAGSLALGLGLASPALADTTGSTSSSDLLTYTFEREAKDSYGYSLYLKSESNSSFFAQSNHSQHRTEPLKPVIFDFSADDGSRVGAYCIEIGVTAKEGASGQLKSWSEYEGVEHASLAGNAELQNKINWIVAHGFPKVDVGELATVSGVSHLTQREAITATQAAIWHLSDGVEFDFSRTGGNSFDVPGGRDRIEGLYEYLTGSANTGLQFTTGLKDASLDLETKTFEEARKVEGGYEVGTVEVSLQTISSVAFQAASIDGVEFTLTDEDGNVVETDERIEAEDGDRLTVVVEDRADGKKLEDTIVFTTDTVTNTLVTGGVIEPTIGNAPSQSIVLVDKGEETLSASAKLSFSVTSEPETPEEPEEPETPEEPEEPETPEEPEEPETPEEPEDPKTPKEVEVPEQPQEEEAPEVTPVAESEDSDDEIVVEQPEAQDESGNLAKTGAENVWLLGATGLLLVGAGVGFYLLRRRA